MKNITITLILLLLIVGCKKEIKIEDLVNKQKVEAYVKNEQKRDSIIKYESNVAIGNINFGISKEELEKQDKLFQ